LILLLYTLHGVVNREAQNSFPFNYGGWSARKRRVMHTILWFVLIRRIPMLILPPPL
jgi:hypothetical protein